MGQIIYSVHTIALDDFDEGKNRVALGFTDDDSKISFTMTLPIDKSINSIEGIKTAAKKAATDFLSRFAREEVIESK